MFFRSFITSGLIASIYTILAVYAAGITAGSTEMYGLLAIFWSLGFLSIIGYVYGRKI